MIKKLDENKFKLGKWAGLIGGIMLILAGLIRLVDYRYFFFENLIFSVPYFLTIFWGVIALIGVLYLHRNNDFGDNLLIYAGALAIFGMFFPILLFPVNGRGKTHCPREMISMVSGAVPAVMCLQWEQEEQSYTMTETIGVL